MFRLPFRSEALDELSSPEQLDEAIQVTSPMSWLAAAILLFIVGATLIWSLFGTIRTRVQGDGMITYQDARHIDIVSRHEGYLAELLVRDGDQVARGDMVARIENNAMAQHHEQAVRTLEEIQREIERLERARDEDINELTRVAQEKRSSLTKSLSDGEALGDILQKRIQDKEADGGDELLQLRQQALRAAQNQDRFRTDLAQLDVMQNERLSVWRKMLLQANQRLARQQIETTRLAAEMETPLTVQAFANGKIVEVLAGVGTFLLPNTPIYRMTNQVSGLYALTFFSGDAAGRIEPGMQAQVSLSTSSEEEFGSLRGVVRDVSRFRLSSDALMTLLGNRQLVERFSRLGAPLAVEVDLLKRSDGLYEWTTSQSAPFEMEPGMPANVSISIREQRPMTILIPALRWLLDNP
jgi:HlyD family secretion protein